MIGWLAVGAALHLEGKAQQKRKAARKAERARLRRESPMPNAVWVVYGILLVAAIASPPAIPGMLIIGVCIWVYAQKRRAEHEAWKAQQQLPTPVAYVQQPTLAQRAKAYERLDMPVSAQVMRDLHDMERQQQPSQHRASRLSRMADAGAALNGARAAALQEFLHQRSERRTTRDLRNIS